MFLSWKAPIEILEHELWTVAEGLHVILGYVLMQESNVVDLTEELSAAKAARFRKKYPEICTVHIGFIHYVIDISTGERKQHAFDLLPLIDEPLEDEIPARTEELFRILRLWRHSMHDKSQCENPSNHDPQKQRWRKEYFVYWGAKNGYALDWLPEIRSAGYMPEYQPQLSNHWLPQTNTADEPQWHVIPPMRSNRDGAAQIHRCLQMMRAERNGLTFTYLEKPKYRDLIGYVLSGKFKGNLRVEGDILQWEHEKKWYDLSRESVNKMLKRRIGNGPRFNQ